VTVGRDPGANNGYPDTDETADRELDALLKQYARAADDSRHRADRLMSGTTLLGGRFTIVRTLGEGGMGAVYEASDAEKRCRVALKTLSKVDPASLYRFKNEFRLIAGMNHPNLVRLDALFAEYDLWFFTMELIEGVFFSRWARPADRFDDPRLRRALLELCEGLSAVHQAGRLHRDLKPSNVLVTSEGRVVVLDFGLAIEPEPGGVGQTVRSHVIAGTPDYMAPEQAAGAPATAPSDCYAIGVMLFEVLAGVLPFTGRTGEVLAAKQRDDAPAVETLAPAAPAELAALCNELLARDPDRRPDLDAIRARVGGTRPLSVTTEIRPPSYSLIGRSRELSTLRDAYRQTLAGEPVIVVVSGESGIGKSALCEEFVSELRRENAAVVLAGRCREQETVPFKALDSIIDELSRYLRRLPPERAAALLPRDIFALRRLFPVLARIEAVAEAPAPGNVGLQELRRRAFSALGELLARIRDRQPLVVCMDDLQWTDLDSTVMLRHLLVDRNPLAGLLILVHRNEHMEQDLLANVLDAAASNRQLRVLQLQLGPLSMPDTELLASELLERADAADAALCANIARESAGSPFFAAELARLARVGKQSPGDEPSLSSALLTRVNLLPRAARLALELLALVGRPVTTDLLLSATQARSSDIDRLRSEQLVRGRGDGTTRLIECYHDRIREIVGASLTDEQRLDHHRALAALLQARDGSNPELLSNCLEQVGDRNGAAHNAALAAEQAAAALAFDRAATLYGRALQLVPDDADGQRSLLVKLGTALEHAGRGRDAARTYRRAATLSSGDEGIELRRHAAEQLLATGHLEEGLALLREVCQAVGLDVAWGKRTALLSYAWGRVQLHFRSLDQAPPHEDDRASARDRLRLRVARTLVTGLIGYLPVQTASNASRYLLMATQHGEINDWIGALGFQAYIQSLIEPGGGYASSLLSRMDQLANECGTAAASGFASLMQGTSAYHSGRYALARQHLAGALQSLRSCSGMDWEIDCANIYDQLSASDSGAYAEIVRTTPPLIEEAVRRGRVWAAAMLSGFGVHAWLVPDNAPQYGIILAEAKQYWRGDAQPRWPDFVMLVGESQQLIYEGKPADAFALFERQHQRYVKSGIMRSAGAGIGGYAAHHARAAAAALGAASLDSSAAARMRTVIRAAAKSLRSRGGDKRTGIAASLEAALLLERGEPAKAHAVLVASADTLEAAGACMLAAAARRRAGQLLPDARGAALIARGDEFMAEQGVKNLEALTEVSCPGCALKSESMARRASERR
jgi:eukaryotic-like serine/threonine-protein kinase